MNTPLDPITRLTSRLLDGELREEEMEFLADLLRTTPGGGERFVLLCELHAMLESEPSIREVLPTEGVPENVVALPGNRAASALAPPIPVADALPLRPGRAAAARHLAQSWGWVMAACLALGMLGFLAKQGSGLQPDGEKGESGKNVLTDAGVGEGREEVDPAKQATVSPVASVAPAAGVEPEEQYERAVLATLGSGSQKRPPTNFTVEPSATEEGISFNRHVRPILSENCYSCHGPDEAARKADLRLDTPEGATGGTSPVVIAGQPGTSELIARITTTTADDLMPPAESHKTLTAKQIEILTRWVAEGASWEDHWSFLPLRPGQPGGGGEFEGHPVDFFVDRELARHRLSRSEEADPVTLIRRATLDLTGLPPTPEEVAAFVENPNGNAYENLLDDLLARPSFGEHRARYWLDAARYGDTHGLHLDNYREIWPYRDWVIRAFNQNLPFDRFTIEQLAGDLLPDATQEQRVATGFNRCNVTTSEGGAIAEEFLVRYAVDRVATTATVWMGLTAGCAQCHDHKFDPITMKDFYALFAYFNNTTQPGMDGNAKDSAPSIRVYETPEQEKEAAALRGAIAKAEKRATEALASIDLAEVTAESVAPDFVNHGNGEKASDLGAAGNFGKTDPFTVSFRFVLPDTDGQSVLVHRTDPDRRGRGWSVTWENQGITVELIDSHPGETLKSGVTRRFKAGASGHFAFSYDGSGRSNGIRLYSNGEVLPSRFVNQWHDSLEGDFVADGASLLVGGKDPVSGLVPTVNEFLLVDRRLADEEIKGLASYAAAIAAEKKPAEKRSDKEKASRKQYLATRAEGPYREALLALSRLQTELSRIEAVTPTTLVMEEKPEKPTAHLLLRGEYEQKGEEVTPAVPVFLDTIKADFPANRLGLAQWLVHPQHPLTARVAVNRIWQELFGVGLVKTSEDFGTQGENPSHPELLDHLARSFVQSGWDVKALYRDIMLSQTYRQSSHMSKEATRRDPENRLLARGPRFRLDAEVIRDQALAASGLLHGAVGGSSVKPYQPAGIWEAVGYTNSNTQTFLQDYGSSSEHRRSLYTFWKRTAHAPNLAILDAPNRESCVMRRERTNTPLQALVLMNDPQYVRASRHLALRVLRERSERDERLDRMATLLRGRPFAESERLVVVNSLDQFRHIYESDPQAAAALLVDEVNDTFTIEATAEFPAPLLAAWTMVANQLQNLDEVLNKN